MGKLRSGLMLLLAAFTLFGCSSGGGGKGEDQEATVPDVKETNEPVTLKIALSMGWLGPDEFQKYFVEPVQRKYPHITLESIDISKPEFSLDKLVAAGNIPDMVMTASPLIFRFTGLGLETDLEPLIKKHGFSLSQLDPVAVDAVRTAGRSDVLTGLPWTRHLSALYYNKDLFDKFGVEYPRDGMTWEELRELAVRLTRNEDGVQYRGLEPDQPGAVASVLSIPAFDPEAKKATLDNDNWKRIFTLLKSIYDIPGNNVPKFAGGAWDQFVKDRTLAMYPTNNRLPNLKDIEGLNWDIVQYPQFKDAPDTAMGVDVWILHITEQSKHKDEAFQVIASVLSEEVQTEMARNARFPVLQTPKIQEEFGKNQPHLAGKHIEAVFKSKPAKALPVSQYDMLSGAILQKSIVAVAKGEKDINTALREAEEEYNRQVTAMK